MRHSSGHLLQRAGREFVRNLLWMAVVFGSLAVILAAATDLSLVGVMAFVGVSAAVMAAIVTVVVLWSGARDETSLSGHDYPGSELIEEHVLPTPLLWVEHYPDHKGEIGEYSLVRFSSWERTEVYLGGSWRCRVGSPAWLPLSAQKVEGLQDGGGLIPIR